jgi:hypothetical protein
MCRSVNAIAQMQYKKLVVQRRWISVPDDQITIKQLKT